MYRGLDASIGRVEPHRVPVRLLSAAGALTRVRQAALRRPKANERANSRD